MGRACRGKREFDRTDQRMMRMKSIKKRRRRKRRRRRERRRFWGIWDPVRSVFDGSDFLNCLMPIYTRAV